MRQVNGGGRFRPPPPGAPKPLNQFTEIWQAVASKRMANDLIMVRITRWCDKHVRRLCTA